jgi:hypothetical protein
MARNSHESALPMPRALLDDRSFAAELKKLDFEPPGQPTPVPVPALGRAVRPRPVPRETGLLDDPAFLADLETVEVESRVCRPAPMMATLLDDPEFIAALEKIDVHDVIPLPRRTMEEWERAQGLRVSGFPRIARNTSSRRTPRQLTSWNYVSLMCLGAGVAIGLFFDRVLRIVLAV